ncbi:hypothetical protein FIC_01842 [Flavobacteriaceae bacterium 3519-10]|nr:hypothetical protein FIC_01842 [Flavobacteriaceae bacterium 3519-10]
MQTGKTSANNYYFFPAFHKTNLRIYLGQNPDQYIIKNP